MSLILHRSATTQALAGELAALLESSPADVFTPEVIAVPERGIERWLAQTLSHHLGRSRGDDGVCAGLDVSSPASFMNVILGRDHDDPWQPDRLVWPVLQSLDELVEQPGFEALGRYLGAQPWSGDGEDAAWRARTRQSRRYSLARRLSGIFATYALERPQLLEQWEKDGDDDVPDDLMWQPPLWRAVCAKLRATGVDETPSQHLNRVCHELRSTPDAFDVPRRVSFFAHTRFAHAELRLLLALAHHREVHLWMTHPSSALWETLRSSSADELPLRDEDDSAVHVNHPLLASLGRESRENEQALLHCAAKEGVTVVDASRKPQNLAPTTRLALLQHDILANRVPSSEPALSDSSISVHACHGPARSVEVLREILLDLFDSSGGAIQPRDVLIMCPDVETYAPLIRAAFGISGAEAHPGHLLPVRMADRGMAALNPLIEIALDLLQLVSSRFTASDVLDLAAKTPVAARFDFDDEARTYLMRWVSESGIRWGLSAGHRREYGVGAITDNTWEAGLNRLALGAVMAADSSSPLARKAPVDDVSGRNAQVAAAFIQFVARLETATLEVRGISTDNPAFAPSTFTVREWTTWLRDSVLGIATVEPAAAWQIAQFERDLEAIAHGAPQSIPLRLSDARALFERRWAPRPSRANFRTGAITVCTMVPMRSVPHKVVVTLGMDDGAYPRQARPDGDDVLARAPRVGERDIRSVDAELLLDALMSASERFIAIYCGFDERTGKQRPPAIPLQQLISAASRTGSQDQSFVMRHPLQAFDERNFVAATSFDEGGLAGAQALRAFHREPPPPRSFLTAPLPPAPASSLITVDELAAFFVNPTREFLKRRLELVLPHEEDEVSNAIPLEAVSLDQWKIGDRYLTARLRGTEPDEVWRLERQRGSLPPGALARRVQDAVTREVEGMLANHHRGSTMDVSATLDDVTISGFIAGVSAMGVEELTYSSVKADHRIRAWIRLLALHASRDDAPQVSVIRSKRGTTGLHAPEPAQARKILVELMGIREAGLRQPLGIPPRTSAAYSESLMHSRKFRRDADLACEIAEANAAETWASGRFPENTDTWYEHVYGPKAPFDVLMTDSGLPQFADTVWRPILEAEERYANL